MRLPKIKAFTLIELIVVITILAILGTIAFFAFQGYSKSARDSVRITDLNNAKSALEYYAIPVGRYPVPSNAVDVTYSGATLWSQGTIGESVVSNLDRMSKLPLDPLFDIQYGYSLSYSKNEFQLATMLEGNSYTLSPLGETYAASQEAYAYLDGDYNGQFIKTKTGGIDYIIATPTIMASDLSNPTFDSIIAQDRLVYHGNQTTPDSYKDVNITSVDSLVYQPSNYVVYSGSLDDLIYEADQVEFVKNLQNSYSGSVIA